tara:strand:+ start:208 stop:1485 length:1278 start_codon:yes stop_codon:yes gene_type:complete
MRKVIIISYFFPPCNLAGANRAGYWAENLNKFDIHPIIITRKWETFIRSFDDVSKPTSHEELVVKDENKTVYYLPHIPSLRDRFLNQNKNRFFLIRKFLSLLEVLINNLHIKASLNYDFYLMTDKILSLDKSINTVIISAMPFNNFFIGYQLKKKFPEIQWVADYRDEWNSRRVNENLKDKILNFYDSFFEKKWVSTARCITYVDNQNLEKVIKSSGNNCGIVIKNGFTNEFIIERNIKKETIVFTFAGTLYSHQNIEDFAKAIKLYSNKNPNLFFEINFLGSAINNNEIAKKIKLTFSKTDVKLNLTRRLPKEELIQYYKKTNFLLMFPFIDKNGVLPTKVLNYLPLKIPILFFPSDSGAIHSLIKSIGFGYAPKNFKEFNNVLEKEKLNPSLTDENKYNKKISPFSAEFHLSKLSNLIKEIGG